MIWSIRVAQMLARAMCCTVLRQISYLTPSLAKKTNESSSGDAQHSVNETDTMWPIAGRKMKGSNHTKAACHSSTLRVATYNVHRCVGIDGCRSEARIARVIASMSADIVGLQELSLRRARFGGSDQAAIIAQQLGWNVLFQPASRNMREHFGNAIISRYPLRLVRVAELPGKSPWYCREPRIALWAEAETNLGAVQVINTHLGLGRSERLLQAELLSSAEWLGRPPGSSPLVFLGDLNSVPGSQPYNCLLKVLHDVRKSVTANKSATFPTYFPGWAMDHILVNDALRPVSVRVHRTARSWVASDHFPLVADVIKDIRANR